MYTIIQNTDRDIEIDIDAMLKVYTKDAEWIGLGGGCVGYHFPYGGYYIIATNREGVSYPNGSNDTLFGIYADAEQSELLAMIEDENELKRNLE